MENRIQGLRQCHQEFLYHYLQTMLLSLLTICYDCCLPMEACEPQRVTLYLRVTSIEGKLLFSKRSSKSRRFDPGSVWMILAISNRKLDKMGLLFFFFNIASSPELEISSRVSKLRISYVSFPAALLVFLRSRIVERTSSIPSSYDNVQRQERISPWFVS